MMDPYSILEVQLKPTIATHRSAMRAADSIRTEVLRPHYANAPEFASHQSSRNPFVILMQLPQDRALACSYPQLVHLSWSRAISIPPEHRARSRAARF